MYPPPKYQVLFLQEVSSPTASEVQVMVIRGIIHISVSIISKALLVPGPIAPNGPTSANPDIDFGPLPISDCVHTPASELFFVEELPGLPIPGHIGLSNGKNMFNGSGEYYPISLPPYKKHRICLVNTSSNTHFKFWINEHTMTVQSVDLVSIESYNTTVLNIAIGNSPIYTL